MEITIGLEFTSKWFEGYVKVEAIDIAQNKLSVRIYRTAEHHHPEDWNLAHTIWGFEKGDYRIK